MSRKDPPPRFKLPRESLSHQFKSAKSKRAGLPRSAPPDPDISQLYLNTSFRTDIEPDSNLPPVFRSKLQSLFSQIEKEFELLYSENVTLQDKIDALNDKLERESFISDKQNVDTVDYDVPPPKSTKPKLSGSSQKIKTAHKLRAQTSKIVSSFKGPSMCCTLVREYTGHRDGVWDVAVARGGIPLVGTASADHTACIWGIDSAKCLLKYTGHSGSVNSIKFHPTRDLILTASGDQSAHIWQAAMGPDIPGFKTGSSDEDNIECPEVEVEDAEKAPVLRTPICELTGHTGVVASADWLPGGDQVVSASWDRTAILYDAETADVLHTLTGHDQELTHISAHHCQRLVVTSSQDTTFRLWDFREPIHSVSVFQGHTETVTSAVFMKREDKIVSGSDDRTVKVWDLRNMRSPLATIRSDAGVNRLSVSSSGIIAVPHDNRQVRLHDPTGHRIARLPRNNRQGHQRMVCSVAWCDDASGLSCNLFTGAFDRLTIGWNVQNIKDM